MLQYIINTTAIWLLGLIVFDMLLRKEAHHGYNRLYLLLVMFAGALIPLWSWDYDAVIYATGVSRPIAEQTAVVRDAIVAGTGQQLLGWEDWLQIVYLSGVGIGVLLLLKDIITIVMLYRGGVKSKDGTWTVVETGKATSPFSAFRYVFVSSRDNYTQDELQMILSHEEQHGHLLHFVDVLICRLFTIVFWFNPMPYLLQHRLLMVHEYQADAAVENNPSTYGQFLIEQSVLNTAPVLAHSFTRSPLKKRILMLTRKTTSAARGKQLLIAPVMLIAMLCFTQNAFSGDEPKKEGNKITYKGNVFEVREYPADTVEVIDPSTGKHDIVITRMDRPAKVVKMNDQKVVMVEEKESNLFSLNAYSKIKSEIGEAISPLISKLPEAIYSYNIHNIVIDKKGAIVYYELEGLKEVIITMGGDKPTSPPEIDKNIKSEIETAIAKVLKTVKIKPVFMDNEPQICALNIQEIFEVE